MEHLDLTQLVADRRASREADAHDHRMTNDDEAPARREPRLRYQRRHRPEPVAEVPAVRQQSVA